MQHLWYSESVEEAFKALHTGPKGLSSEEVKKRLKKCGPNKLPQEKPYPKALLLLRQFESPLVLILLIAVAVSIYLLHYSDAIFVMVVLAINISVSFYQENKANASFRALREIVKVTARVFRDGNMKEVNGEELVPGDVILLRAGDKVPADVRLMETKDLSVNESGLTGEWMPARKTTQIVPVNAALGDRKNMAFMGTIAEEGSATAVVVETGKRTAFGKIVSLLRETKERPTPLQEKISKLSVQAGIFIIGVSFFVVVLGILNGKSFSDIFVAALALAVSAIPEGLLPAITVVLMLGMQRILKQKGLVRKLIANETLGSVTVICTDKTGTLTEGKMEVSHILTGEGELLHNGYGTDMEGLDKEGGHILALKAGVLSNEAFIENPDDEKHDWVVRGRPTDRALLVAGAHAGLSQKKLIDEYPVIERFGFTSAAKYSATLHSKPEGGRVLYVLGAPEILIDRAVDFLSHKESFPLGSGEHQKLTEKIKDLAQNGSRIVACAYRDLPQKENGEHIEALVRDLTIIGYIALKDPLREDAAGAVALTKRAGIRTVLITGDHRLTAQSIAAEVGIDVSDDRILEGKELDLLSDEDLAKKANVVSIYARVTPEHKLRIVEALQSRGEVVAMIGDGVNDAPALKASDVGVALGSGTDVAKEVSDIVLLDDSFKTIVNAVEQGRLIFQNIRKVFVYLIADDFSELFLFLGATALGFPLPLLAVQILWINIVEDGFPNIALTTEQETAGLMDEKPRDPNEPILNRPMKYWMTTIFFISGLAAFLSFFFIWKATGDIERTRTIVFALMCFDSLTFAFSARSFKQTVFRRDIFSNVLLFHSVLAGLILLFAAIYVPFLQAILFTVPIGFAEWALILGISTVELILIESSKKKIFAV